MDMSIVCRSCMKEVASWEKENFDQTSIDMFCFCTNILITDCDKLPRQFCYDCFIKIESSYTFIKEAQRVNITLKNIVSRIQTSIIVELDNNQRIYDTENTTSSYTFHNVSLDENNIHLDENTIFHDEAGIVNEDDYVPSLVQDNIESIPYTIVTEEVKNIGNSVKEPNEKEVDIPAKKKNITNTQQTKPDQMNGHKTKSIKCPVCGKSFTFKAWLDRHVSGEHESTYTCEHCPKTFSKPSQKSEHLVSHSTERQYVCSICNARFKRRKQLTVHIRNHNNVRPHCCQECGMSFKQKSTLKSHMLLHEESKPFLCSICGWSFAQAGNLQAHMRTHTGEKPFRCEQCPFTCAAASNLARHRHRHTESRRHVCQHCRRGFYDASSLARHTRSHTGEQPYKCPYCSRAFVDSWKRKSHLMRAHKFALRDIPRMPRDPGPAQEGTPHTGG